MEKNESYVAVPAHVEYRVRGRSCRIYHLGNGQLPDYYLAFSTTWLVLVILNSCWVSEPKQPSFSNLPKCNIAKL